MTKKPCIVDPKILAAEALAIMEDKNVDALPLLIKKSKFRNNLH